MTRTDWCKHHYRPDQCPFCEFLDITECLRKQMPVAAEQMEGRTDEVPCREHNRWNCRRCQMEEIREEARNELKRQLQESVKMGEKR